MATQWYVKRGDDETGPVPFRDLVEMVRKGELTTSDRVRPSYKTDWQWADSVVGLFHMARRSPEELLQPEQPAPEPVVVEPIADVTDEPIAERPNWLKRLWQIGGPDKKIADIPILGPSRNAGVDASGAGVSGPAGRQADSPVDAGQRAAMTSAPETLLPELQAAFDRAEGGGSSLAGAIDEAMSAAQARSASARDAARGGRFARLFGRIAGTVPTSDEGRQNLRIGFRIVAAIVCANLAALAIENWSAGEALRFPTRGPSAVQYFPLIGECTSTEYLVLMLHLMLATGALAWFAAGWLEAHAEDR
jgi:hypothetical protein